MSIRVRIEQEWVYQDTEPTWTVVVKGWDDNTGELITDRRYEDIVTYDEARDLARGFAMTAWERANIPVNTDAAQLAVWRQERGE